MDMLDFDLNKLLELGVTGFLAIFSVIKIYQLLLKVNNKLNTILALLGKNNNEDNEEE